MKKIGIDFTYINMLEVKNNELNNSLSEVLLEILDSFSEKGIEDKFVIFVRYYAFDLVKKRLPMYKVVPIGGFFLRLLYKFTKGKRLGLSYIKKRKLYEKAAKKENIEIIWNPYLHPCRSMYYGLPYVGTVHDLIQYHEFDDKFKNEYNNLLKKSTKVIAISDYVRKDLGDSIGVNIKEVSVIPNSIVLNMDTEKPIKQLIGKEYILDINGYGKHKNTLTLLKAFNNIKNDTNVNLVFCGNWKDEIYYLQIEEFIRENKLEDRVFLFYQISFAERNWLLKNAKLFCTPSLQEGFGRTPVEAAICCVPVVSTKETSLYEATNGLVNYYNNPCDDNELADMLITILKKQPDEKKLMEISNRLSELYSPDKCAELYLDVFQSL